MSLHAPYRDGAIAAGHTRVFAEQMQAIGEATAEMPQLARTSERLHCCISELDGLVAKLESALDPVLNPDMTAKNAGNTAAALEPIRCPIGRSMDARSDEVYAITLRVRSLLDRLAC